jgi:putative tricarboxylic transport membrane protein
MAVGIFFTVIAVKLGLGRLSAPGPGLVPLIMAVLLVCLSLFTFPKGLFNASQCVKNIFWRRQAATLVVVLIYSLLLSRVGFLFSTFVLLSILFGLLTKGDHKWPRVLFYAAIMALAAWLIFSVALKIPFPSPRLWGIRM